MPNSGQRQFQTDADMGPPEQVQKLVAAVSPFLGTAMMGVPGLSVPTGVVKGLPISVQLVARQLREDRLPGAGEIIERAAGYSALDALDALDVSQGRDRA